MGDEGSDEGRNAMMSHYSYPPCVRSGAVFLGDARIRDASIAQRLSFLEEKGLSRAEANQAFSLFRRLQAAAAAAAASSSSSSSSSSSPSARSGSSSSSGGGGDGGDGGNGAADDPLASLAVPQATYVPPGQCVLGAEEWTSTTLIRKASCGPATRVFTFSLPDPTRPLGLSTCACILARAMVRGSSISSGGSSSSGGGGRNFNFEEVVRPYTPISTNAMVGKFELMVKIYPSGRMGQHLDSMAIGDSLDFKHIPFNVKLQYPVLRERRALGMLCGGTGVTPMLQALHCLLDPSSSSSSSSSLRFVSMLYGSRTRGEILAEDILSSWADLGEEEVGRSGMVDAPSFRCTHVLSEEPPYAPVYVFPQASSDWAGPRGNITAELVQEHMPPPTEDCVLLVCGPPAMYAALCGPRDQEHLSGILSDLGYSKDQVYKF